MDTVDYDPDVLEREAAAREKMTTPPPVQRENPQQIAINQMVVEAYWREVTLRANMIAMMQAKEDGRA